MSGPNPRAAAVAALVRQEQDGFSNLILDAELRRQKLEGRDKAFASAIFYTVLEHQGTLDYILSQFLPKGLAKLDPQVREILRAALAQGDTGIRSFQTVTLSAASGTASTAALVIVKPLAQITLGVASLMTEKDLLNQIPSLPQVKDGACLGFLLGAGAAVAASTTFAGQTEFVWG